MNEPVGVARLERDGALVLSLRAEGPGSVMGDARFTYRPDHPEYQSILEHLGGIEVGQEKPVPPWDRGEALRR